MHLQALLIFILLSIFHQWDILRGSKRFSREAYSHKALDPAWRRTVGEHLVEVLHRVEVLAVEGILRAAAQRGAQRGGQPHLGQPHAQLRAERGAWPWNQSAQR